jgi:hypothetical protein
MLIGFLWGNNLIVLPEIKIKLNLISYKPLTARCDNAPEADKNAALTQRGRLQKMRFATIRGGVQAEGLRAASNGQSPFGLIRGGLSLVSAPNLTLPESYIHPNPFLRLCPPFRAFRWRVGDEVDDLSRANRRFANLCYLVLGDGGGNYIFPAQPILSFSCFRWRVGRGTRTTSAKQISDLRYDFRGFRVMNSLIKKDSNTSNLNTHKNTKKKNIGWVRVQPAVASLRFAQPCSAEVVRFQRPTRSRKSIDLVANILFAPLRSPASPSIRLR